MCRLVEKHSLYPGIIRLKFTVQGSFFCMADLPDAYLFQPKEVKLVFGNLNVYLIGT